MIKEYNTENHIDLHTAMTGKGIYRLWARESCIQILEMIIADIKDPTNDGLPPGMIVIKAVEEPEFVVRLTALTTDRINDGENLLIWAVKS